MSPVPRVASGPLRRGGAAAIGGSLLALLESAAEGDAGIILLGERDAHTTIPYAQLLERSQRFASGLTGAGVSEHDPVVLVLADTESFLVAFWGCLSAGAVPVPLSASPTPERRDRLRGVIARFDRPWLVADRPLHVESARLLAFELVAKHAVRTTRRAEPGDTALIQMTSGSTGEPRAVRLSHANLCANVAAISARCRFDEGDRSLSWLPLTHDMGLVGFHLTPLANRATQILMPPGSFVRRPGRWLREASQLGATVLGAPCWGLEQVLQRTPPAGDDGIELRGVRTVFLGADTVDSHVCAAFAARMAPRGLAPEALLPVYGLAEASLAVSIPRHGGVRARWLARGQLALGDRPGARGAGDQDAIALVCVGSAVDGLELRIAGPSGALAEGTVGRIEVRGASVSSEVDDAVRAAEVWLDTGDLGLLVDGELFVTGRDKQIAIVAGETYPLHEIEAHARRALGPRADVGACALGADVVLFVRHGSGDFAPVARRAAQEVLLTTGLTLRAVVPIGIIPRTASGKIRREALRARWAGGDQTPSNSVPRGGTDRDSLVDRPSPGEVRSEAETAPTFAEQARDEACDDVAASGRQKESRAVLEVLHELVRDVGGPASLKDDRPLLDAGLGSLMLVRLGAAVSARFGVELDEADLFAHPTLARMAERITSGRVSGRVGEASAPRGRGELVAIVGMAVRVASADGLSEFWRALVDGADGIAPMSAARQADLDAFAARSGEPVAKPCNGGWLARIDHFEPEAFGLTSAEAAAVAPGQRVLLELASAALHDAGVDRAQLARWRAGVFVGHIADLDGSGYGRVVRAVAPSRVPAAVPGNLGAFLAGRLARSYDLRGPVLAVDTACSSSLVALHLACRAIRDGECDVALSGAVRVAVLPRPGELGIESPSGTLRPFDLDADGTVDGEGGAVLLLAPLALAQRVGLPIHAVIRGTAVAHDGTSASLTAPNPDGQTRAIVAAWRGAHIAPDDLAFVETHGTGTLVGDPLEVAGLVEARRQCGGSAPMLLGAIKSSVGHLQEAAGVVGVVKAVLALRHRELPPTLHHRRPHPRLARERLSLSASAVAIERRFAGVSSFGLSGTNAHVVLERGSDARPLSAPAAFSRRRVWIEADRERQGGLDRASVLARIRVLLRDLGDGHVEDGLLDVSIFELGFDSLMVLSLRQAIEAEYRVRLELGRMFGAHVSLAALADEVVRAVSAAPPIAHPVELPATEPEGAPPESRVVRPETGPSVPLALASPRLGIARTSVSFRARQGEGAWITDVHGRRCVDLTCGFGVCLFGHAPGFLQRALRDALDEPLPLGPMSELPEMVATSLCRLTGVERVAFFSTGSEAVMIALRLARARTGRTKVVQFEGSYHGHTDGVLVGPSRGVPGVHRAASSDTTLLPWGDPRALEYVNEHGAELAAVLVEPVQSRRPGIVPTELLRGLREVTARHGVALIFDEMITGFRCHPGGARARFGIDADLVTYGKILGGGLPIGAVAGSAAFLAGIDGVNRTFAAGTFNQNPLTMAAAQAVLRHLEASGPELQRTLDARTESLALGLDEIFRRRSVPVRVERFSSMFRLAGRADLDALFHRVLEQGVYVWEGRTCFLSTAHGEAELAHVLEAFDSATRPSARASAGDTLGAGALALHLEIEGALDVGRLARAWESVTRRHAALGPAPALEVTHTGEMSELLGRPFDSPLRAMLVTPDRGRAALALVGHRSRLDGWSLGVLVNELAAAYDGEPLPTTSVAEVPAWPPPPGESYRAEMRVDVLDEAMTRSLRVRARSERVTLFALLALTVGTVFADGAEVTLAVPMRSSSAPMTEVGPRTHHARLTLRPDPALDVAIATNRDELRRLFEGHVVGDQASLARVVFNYDRVDRLRAPSGLRLRYLTAPLARTAHPLVVNVVDLGDELRVEWKWAVDCHDRVEIAGAAARLLEYLRREVESKEKA